jgi:hypothetical protein
MLFDGRALACAVLEPIPMIAISAITGDVTASCAETTARARASLGCRAEVLDHGLHTEKRVRRF